MVFGLSNAYPFSVLNINKIGIWTSDSVMKLLVTRHISDAF